MRKLRAGIVGCGGIANGKHLPAMQKSGLYEVVAFCDIIIERAQETKEKFGTEDAKVFEDYRELLKEDLDVVYVTTPNRSHAEISIAAMEAGRDVMCEKPMAKNYAEAQKMVETAERTHRVLNIGYQNRYRTDSLYLKEMCKSDELGEIYFAKAHALRRRAVPTWGVFLNEEEQGGGPLIDIGTHALDLTLWMMDNYEVQSVTGASFHKLSDQTDQGNAFGNWDPDKFCVEDSAFGFIRMKNGAVIELESAWALNTLEVDEAKTSLCGTKAGADMKDGLRINYIHHNTQVVEKPELSSGGVAFFSGKEKSAADYFSGLALGLFQDAKEEEVNLNSINVMSTVGEERYATSNYIKEYFSMKGEKSNAYMFASSTINAPNDTKGGLLATFRQKIRNFSTGEALSEMLSYSDFNMKDIGNGKTAVFMIIHDEKKTYHPLMTIFIKQCYETLIDVAQENGGKLPVRTNFILDEFANMPPLKDVDAMVSAARSRDIRFTFIIQNFAQLNDVYGDNVAEIIKGNCGNLVYLISTEMKALEEISKMCGEVKVTDEKDKNATRPLITITDLQKMKLFEAIIIRLRTSPFRTKLEPDFKMEWGIERKEEEYPNRMKHEVEMFDLKKFVTEERSKKMAQNDNNPFKPMDFGMPSYNPFGMSSANSGFKPNPSGLSSMDIDSMLKDLDEKFKELDRQEEEQKKNNIDTKSDDKLL